MAEQQQNRLDFESETKDLQDKVKQYSNDICLERVKNQKLQFEITEIKEASVSKLVYEKLTSALQIAESEIVFKNSQIAEQKSEIEQLNLIVRQLHSHVAKACVSANIS